MTGLEKNAVRIWAFQHGSVIALKTEAAVFVQHQNHCNVAESRTKIINFLSLKNTLCDSLQRNNETSLRSSTYKINEQFSFSNSETANPDVNYSWSCRPLTNNFCCTYQQWCIFVALAADSWCTPNPCRSVSSLGALTPLTNHTLTWKINKHPVSGCRYKYQLLTLAANSLAVKARPQALHGRRPGCQDANSPMTTTLAAVSLPVLLHSTYLRHSSDIIQFHHQSCAIHTRQEF